MSHSAWSLASGPTRRQKSRLKARSSFPCRTKRTSIFRAPLDPVAIRFYCSRTDNVLGTFDKEAFLTSLGTIHFSPNKTGVNAGNPTIDDDPPYYAPEPGSLALFGIGLAALAMRRRKAKK